jgi:hypothetical protein
MADTFGAPEISQEQAIHPTSNSRTVIILLIIIIAGAAVLGYLLYKQSKEEAPVLEEVTQSIEIPTTPTRSPEAGISEPTPETTLPETENTPDSNLSPSDPSFFTNPAR